MPIDRTFFISKKKEIAYLNIAKSGCTSIKASLSYLRDKPLNESRPNVHDPRYYNFYFLDVVKESSSYLKECFKFTFVRNPIERVISFYKNKILSFDPAVTPYYGGIGIKHKMPFEAFISKLVTIDHSKLEQHLSDQYLKVINDNNIVVDFIGKIEEIDIHWQILNNYMDETLPIKRMNQTKADSSFSPSEEMLLRLKKYYEIDMVLFGYDKSIPVPAEMKDIKDKIDKVMAEKFANKKIPVKNRSQSEFKALERYSKKSILSPLNDNDIDIIKDIALFLEKFQLHSALKLMSIAKKLRPNGPLICRKVKEYETMIESQE